ncbi:Uncharacterized protein OS=Singulisphaera acidiphila (strain ATCC BAA-1392 / DSM 18658 / VKM B-2454 / MOB10) GN=Sinac_0391 PE=4 SV=1: DUF2171 [Gemmata massiliana]|uniref:DUF2171 domain-containing protein n=1 Tax=Gemmata massiliana TaxID=1210884 RepID=A0A6P2CTP2_9BACT|nr:DUF2171 domain-containing protein [Gemmata massiliana]VTR92341.1 Uncharacterized protein OS=Singulisphaera acidiphila (strain ATCC BAA-1392 / DSM 18658 / VKM B-2454 / MOB10) GN=Sinac_0391 PE=4 SV=1: DUF2171 [Gemmata massiliana]
MKGTNNSDIREHMDVFGSCGNQLGTVDHVEGNEIKLSRSGAKANGQHHWIPLGWVDSVDNAVRLNKDCGQAVKEWRSESVATGGAR